MSATMHRRLSRMEQRTRQEEHRPVFIWIRAAVGECVAACPLLEAVAQRCVDRALQGAAITFWPVDDRALWPALAAFREWFDRRFPGRWGEIGHPFPERRADGSWQSRE